MRIGRVRLIVNRPARIAKIGMAASLSVFALLVGFNNLTDYGSNFQFVRHVLAMDTVFSGNRLTWRALSAPWEWHASYLAIIAGELLTGMLFAMGALEMRRRLAMPGESFTVAKRFIHYATLTGFLVWFLGFSVVGGEWFVMWQSRQWNGQEPAFRFLITILAVCIYIQQDD